jgi:hypothetical protein
VLSPHELDIIENSQVCQMARERLFYDLCTEALEAFEAIKCATGYAKGAVLFVEGQMSSAFFIPTSTGKKRVMAWANAGIARARSIQRRTT